MSQVQRVRGAVAEALVIVVSILLAFALDAGWDARGDRVEAVSLRSALAVDFDAIRVEMDRARSRNELVIAAADSILAHLGATSGQADVPVAWLAPLLLTPTTDPRSGTLSTLIASGRLSIVGSPRLRGMLSEWPALLSDVREEELAAKTFVHEQLTPYLGRSTDLSRLYAWRLNGLSLASGSERLTVVDVHFELVNLIRTRRFLAGFVLNNYEGLEASLGLIRPALAGQS